MVFSKRKPPSVDRSSICKGVAVAPKAVALDARVGKMIRLDRFNAKKSEGRYSEMRLMEALTARTISEKRRNKDHHDGKRRTEDNERTRTAAGIDDVIIGNSRSAFQQAKLRRREPTITKKVKGESRRLKENQKLRYLISRVQNEAKNKKNKQSENN